MYGVIVRQCYFIPTWKKESLLHGKKYLIIFVEKIFD